MQSRVVGVRPCAHVLSVTLYGGTLQVGAGPASLAAAIRMKQLSAEKGTDLSVCVVEKGAEVGSHIVSGNVFEPRALEELLPDWKELGAPLDTPVTKDQFLLLSEKSSLGLPHFLLPKEEVRTLWCKQRSRKVFV
jgi:flavin-dependent dehydrogenase